MACGQLARSRFPVSYAPARRLVAATPLCHRLTTIHTPHGRTLAAAVHSPAGAARFVAQKLGEAAFDRPQSDRFAAGLRAAEDVDGKQVLVARGSHALSVPRYVRRSWLRRADGSSSAVRPQ
jgi:hypothetical protein